MNHPKSFKENIRKMVTRYSIIPVFIFTFILLGISVEIWSHFTSNMVQKESVEKAKILTKVIREYQDALDKLSVSDDLLTETMDIETKTQVYDIVYSLSRKTGYEADFYILQTDGTVKLQSTQDVPEYIEKEEYANWGIMLKMSQKPEETVLHINTIGRSSLCLGKAILKDDRIQGYIVAIFSADTFSRFLSDFSSQSVVTDDHGWVFLANNYIFRDNMNRFEQKMKSGFIIYEGHWFYIEKNELTAFPICIYNISDTHVRTELAWGLLLGIIIIFVATIVITHVSVEKIADINSRDVAKIADTFLNVQEGNLDSYLQMDSSIEFMEIAESYNLMLDSLKEQIEHNKEMAEHMAFAQVKQLESQFNPHFIFNTLDNIRFMMKIDQQAADKMIVALSKILRYSISNTGETITVKEDLSYIESYLTIAKIRFNRRLQYELAFDEEIMHCLIPKLVIQPLLENAIKYGFADKEQLHLCIKGYRKADKLIFVCEDNGGGLDEELLKELRDNLAKEKNESSHLGLYNIHRRIQLLYKNNTEYGLRIESKKGEGAIVTLVLPWLMAEE